MRTLLQVELDTETANKLIVDDALGKVLGELLAVLRPESAYFYAENGHRAMSLVVDLADPSWIPSVCEPFWVRLNATVRVTSCMNAEELKAGLARVGQA